MKVKIDWRIKVLLVTLTVVAPLFFLTGQKLNSYTDLILLSGFWLVTDRLGKLTGRIAKIEKEIGMEKQDLETCPRCNGTGDDPDLPWGHLRAQDGPAPCILCRGAEVVPKGKTEPDPIFPIIRPT